MFEKFDKIKQLTELNLQENIYLAQDLRKGYEKLMNSIDITNQDYQFFLKIFYGIFTQYQYLTGVSTIYEKERQEMFELLKMLIQKLNNLNNNN